MKQRKNSLMSVQSIKMVVFAKIITHPRYSGYH